ncbi:MAG: isochorismate synthase [Leptolyngbyaceae cyanobacterium bins.302]|nr:isochorismate synthase [Leptolyngbyaceae cyanobacterium bins.302]
MTQPQGIAIAALNSVLQFQTQDTQRFAQVKHFIQATLADVIMAGALTEKNSGPTFFCSFSFQNKPSNLRPPDFSGATVFLPEWQVSNQNRAGLATHNLIIDRQTSLEKTAEKIWQMLHQIQTIQPSFTPASAQYSEQWQHQEVATTETFKRSVRSALQSIQAQQFNKIVLAHAVDVVSANPFHPVACLNNLRQLYPNCYLFAVHNGMGQAFLGASPERLVWVQNRQLITDALAGSAPRGQTLREDALLATALLNSEKDNYEHQVVVDFITQKLTALGLTPQLSPLKLLQLSNIQHLHTPIQATLPASVHLLDVLAELHPTPAVAGLPRDVACAEIDRQEPFERSLYAAPIGWVNHRGEGEFAVGIRSALIDGCRARLFAGAGIVAGSDPERELAEVQLKLQALLAALR